LVTFWYLWIKIADLFSQYFVLPHKPLKSVKYLLSRGLRGKAPTDFFVQGAFLFQLLQPLHKMNGILILFSWFVLKSHASCWNLTRACISHTRACHNHTRACHNHTRACHNHTHTCQKHTLRVESTLVRVEITVVSVVITFVRVKITMRVKIKLCVYESY
jgi:hypothetical protein